MTLTKLLTIGTLLLGLNFNSRAQDEHIMPYVVISGSDSHITTPNCLRIISESQWDTTWLEHKGWDKKQVYDKFYNRLGIPVIDFKKCMVIAVFLGETWNTAGMSVIFIQEGNDKIVLGFDLNTYQTMDSGDQVNPYGFFVLPRSSKQVLLQINVQSLPSRNIKEPPVWKDYHQFPALKK
jgi:hypothetical protein